MNHEIAIVGGGVVGLGLACALGEAGARVAIVEAAPLRQPNPARATDARVSALTPASKAWLQRLAVWPDVPPCRYASYEHMRVWDAGSKGEVHFAAAELGLASLGTVVENIALQQALEARVDGLDTVRWYRPATLESIDIEANDAVLTLSDARLRAKLVVGADGARSSVRAMTGIELSAGDFSQRAVVANFETELGHGDTAWQRFLAQGPLALLPLPDGHVSIVWSTTPEQAHELCTAAPAQVCREVELASEGRLGQLSLSGPVRSFPLTYHHARHYVAPRVALVGDAAHAIHPLAGQGVNLGLLDAAALAQVITQLRQRGRDCGRVEYLRRYQRWRKGHNLAVAETMRAFHHLFTSASLPLRLLRGVGFSMTDSLPALKRRFIRQATGLHGDLPNDVRDALATLQVV